MSTQRSIAIYESTYIDSGWIDNITIELTVLYSQFHRERLSSITLVFYDQALHIHLAHVILTRDLLMFNHFCLWLLISIHIPLLLQSQADVYSEAINNKHDSKESK